MSTDKEKIKNSSRRHRDDVAIQRQLKIAKTNQYDNDHIVIKEPHRLAKHRVMNCGKPKCILCSNPRKTWKELTPQEKRLFQDMDNTRNTHTNGQSSEEDLFK